MTKDSFDYLSLNKLFDDVSIDTVGFPIKCNKTHIQLNDLLMPYVKSEEDAIFDNLMRGKLYNAQSNSIDTVLLPTLGSLPT